jgi:hypothetical protein
VGGGPDWKTGKKLREKKGRERGCSLKNWDMRIIWNGEVERKKEYKKR